MKEPKDYRILIVEDDQLSREILAEYLKELDFKVILAEHGIQGLSKAKDMNPDLILLDIMMPRMDGYQFLSKMIEEKIDIPVIVTTALSMLDSVKKAMQLGARGYLIKPIDLNNLKEKLNAILSLDLAVDKTGNFQFRLEVDDRIVVVYLEGSLSIEGLISIRSEIVNKAKKVALKTPKIIMDLRKTDETSYTVEILKEMFAFYSELPSPNMEHIKIVANNTIISSYLKDHAIAKHLEICGTLEEAFARI